MLSISLHQVTSEQNKSTALDGWQPVRLGAENQDQFLGLHRPPNCLGPDVSINASFGDGLNGRAETPRSIHFLKNKVYAFVLLLHNEVRAVDPA